MNILDITSNFNNGKQDLFQSSISDFLNIVDVDANVENDHRELLEKQR